MTKDILMVVRWLLALGKRFARYVPVQTVCVVFATLVSQISLLLAFILPLKIIILLGSSGIPRYFPASFAQFDRTSLIVWLMVATACFYVAHIVSEKVIFRASSWGCQSLLRRTRKIALFEAQDRVADKAYRAYAEALAESVFVMLVLVLFAWIFPEVAVFVLAYLVLAALILAMTYKLSNKTHGKFIDQIPAMISVYSALGFMAVFVFIVVSILTGHPVPLLAAIVSMLLSRQLFARVSSIVGCVLKLLDKRAKINALFFHTQQYVKQEKTVQRDFWTQFEPRGRDAWLSDVVSGISPEVSGSLSFEWRQSGIQNMVSFIVSQRESGKRYFLNIYSAGTRSLAVNEATLLTTSGLDGLPAPDFIGGSQVGDSQAHLFELPVVDTPVGSRYVEAVNKVRDYSIALQPPESVVAQFTRSKPMLWSRMDDEWIERLRCAVVSQEEEGLLEGLSEHWSEMRQLVSTLPVTLINLQVTPDNMASSPDTNEPILLCWGQWTIEPLGFNLDVKPQSVDQAMSVVEQSHRDDCEGLSAGLVKLTARLTQFERLFRSQRYRSAIQLIPELLKDFSECNVIGETSSQIYQESDDKWA